MRRRRLTGAGGLLLGVALLLASPSRAQDIRRPAAPEPAPPAARIVDVRVEGNKRLSDAAFFRLTTLRSGQPFDPVVVRRQFRALWDSGSFDDLWVEVLDAPGGKVVVFHIVERPVLIQVTYDHSPVISQTAIDDRLKERNLMPVLNAPLDRERVRAIEEEVKHLHEEKGYLGTTVKGEVRAAGEGTQSVRFQIQVGSRTVIKHLDFTGNSLFSDRELRHLLKTTRQSGFRGLFSSKDLYHPMRLGQDLESVRTAYLAKGRLDVQLKPPIVTLLGPEPEENPKEAARKQEKQAKREAAAAPRPPPPNETEKQRTKRLAKEAKRRAKAEEKTRKDIPPKRKAQIVVPIVEGPEYRLGDLTLTGNKVIGQELLRPLIPLRSGEVFNADSLKTGLDAIESVYGQRGYFYASTNRDIKRREGNVADVEVTVAEGQQYTLHRIEFEGNPSTRDRVLRRELPLHEGEIFDARRWRIGLTRINQLGYWSLEKEPEITPVEGEAALDARIRGSEQGRNEIQVGGGFSGQEGAFFQGSYSTRNFLGRGEILQTSVQTGGRSELVNISFTEPYFLGTNNTLGGSIFSRNLQFSNFNRSSQGFSLLFGQRIRNFGSWSMTYRNERFDETGGSIIFLNPARLPPEFAGLDAGGLFAGDFGTPIPNGVRTTNSSLIPLLTYNTVNNPLHPTRGLTIRTSLELTGTFLGGDNEFMKPLLQTSFYLPVMHRTTLALHAEGGYVEALNGHLIPRSERFFLGGDTRGPRIFQTRSLAPFGPVAGVSPIADSEGNVIGIPFAEVGGNSFALLQSELVFSVSQPLDLALFLDAGNAFAENGGFDLGNLRYSTGIEARFFLPVFQAPLRLIWGKVLDEKPGDQLNSFQFSIGFPF
jgi:outer membrane protein insertion porin family